MKSKILNVHDVITVAQEINEHCNKQGFWDNETFNIEVIKDIDNSGFEYNGNIYSTSYEVACVIKEQVNNSVKK